MERANDRFLLVDNGIARVASFYAASASRGEPAIFREGFLRIRKTGRCWSKIDRAAGRKMSARGHGRSRVVVLIKKFRGRPRDSSPDAPSPSLQPGCILSWAISGVNYSHAGVVTAAWIPVKWIVPRIKNEKLPLPLYRVYCPTVFWKKKKKTAHGKINGKFHFSLTLALRYRRD